MSEMKYVFGSLVKISNFQDLPLLEFKKYMLDIHKAEYGSPQGPPSESEVNDVFLEFFGDSMLEYKGEIYRVNNGFYNPDEFEAVIRDPEYKINYMLSYHDGMNDLPEALEAALDKNLK